MTIDEALRQATGEAVRGAVTFPADLQGFPGTVHGGAVAAALHRLALPLPPVEVHLALLRGVPTVVELRLRTGSAGATARLALLQGERLLAEATVRREGVDRPESEAARAAWAAGHADGQELPRTTTCLACGSANPLGLDLRLRASDRFLWQEYPPRPPYRTRDGTVHPALAFIGLDELGWWLGALALGECGVTTDVRITLVRPIPDAPLLFLGDRAAVARDDDDRERYCRSRGLLLDPGGRILAASDIRFAGSRAYTRRLLEPFLATTPLDRLARWFPSVKELAQPRARP